MVKYHRHDESIPHQMDKYIFLTTGLVGNLCKEQHLACPLKWKQRLGQTNSPVSP